MTHIRRRLLAAAAVTFIVATGCGASKSSGGSGGGGGTGTRSANHGTYTVGVLTDLSGPLASSGKTTPDGIKAGTIRAARDGYTIKYVMADTGTSPSGALAAAQKLVTQHHVLAVIANSALTFSAAGYLTAHGVPVIGPGADAAEWITSKNMFSIFGSLHTTNVATTVGKFLKTQGVTNVATLGYGVAPVSAEAAKTAAESARVAGIKVGYLNPTFAFGSTDVQPVALAMKNAGVDGVVLSVTADTSYALITALRQQGVNIKVALLGTGYGGDLLVAGPGAVTAAQNVYYSLGFEPVELGTPATRQFVSDLKSAGVTSEPTFSQYAGYVSIGLLVRGLEGAGANATQSSLIKALSAIHDFDALGLFGTHRLDINDRKNIVLGVDNCLWITKLQGRSFTPVAGAQPICGEAVPGKTVSPNS